MKVEDLTLDEDTIKFSDTLNRKIWVGEELKPQVYNNLIKIAQAFIDYLDIDLNVVDIHFTGSMANYNFNPDSDIDLHIIADFDQYNIDYQFLSDYFNAKKSLFNQNHDITIYGHPVELYVEDKNMPAKSNGVYSLRYDKWIKKPNKIEVEVEDVIDSPKFIELMQNIENILSSNYNVDEAQQLLDSLYIMRKDGLTSGGELSEDNLIFKKLRSLGYLQDLRTYITKNYDKSLSLESQQNNIKLKLSENFQKIDNDLMVTNNMYDIKRILQQNPNQRLLYDRKFKLYLISPSDNFIHYDMVIKAWKNGFFPSFKTEWEIRNYIDDDYLLEDPNQIRVVFSNTYDDYESDGYKIIFIYDSFVMYDRGDVYYDNKCLPLLSILGKPKEIKKL